MKSAVTVALVALLVAGCAHGGRAHRGRSASPGPASVATQTAAPATVRPTVQIAGIVAPYQNVAISSSLSEPTDSVSVVQGDYVRRGQTLAVLDTTDLRASFTAAQRSAESSVARVSQTQYQAELNIGQGGDQVRNAKAALGQAQQTLALDEKNLTRLQTLLNSGYVSQQQVDQQRTTVRNDQQQVSSAQASLQSATLNAKVNGSYQTGLQAANVASAQADAASAQAQAQQIAAQIDKADIVSSVDGVVVNRNLNPGEYPGSRTIFTVQQLDPVYAELNASSEDVFRIRRGAAVTVTVAGVNTAPYRGRINAVLGQVAPGSTNFTVEAILANPGYRLKSGMAVTGTVDLPAVTGIGVPATSFLDDAHDSLMLVGSDGTAKLAKVSERGSDGKTSIVTGIPSGAKVIANGQLGITSGQQIAGESPEP
ncbi:MAG TPA: efflux RND transporter periplasmic adaptor subunit [Candidatus Cybelea sp.]|jgi:multidrug efflux pump subunit AcrA (membrane-fusion protein)|nr:efflux RND transporter periplasmic adaptor subunit [Candidatus Cybelea sp.]